MRVIFNTVQNAKKKKLIPQVRNTAIPQFKIKITEIPQEKHYCSMLLYASNPNASLLDQNGLIDYFDAP